MKILLDTPERYGQIPSMFVRSSNKQIPTGTGRRVDAAAMRALNTSLLLHHIFEEEPISRAALSRATGMARSTVSAIVAELVEAGVVAESPGKTKRAGRPPIALHVQADRFQLVGVEMGASHLMVVRTDLRGRILGRASVDHPVQHDPEGTLETLGRLLDALLPEADRDAVVGVGLAVPSPLDPALPGRLSHRILPAWADVRPADAVSARVGLPVIMENDANLGALAEAWWGEGRRSRDFAYIKLATGVGAGLIVGGDIYGGAAGIAGEIGHTAIDPERGPRCRCGRTGCLEALIGTQSLLARVAERLEAGAVSSLTAGDLSLAQVLSAASAGDPVAGPVLTQAGQDLGVAIANLLNLLNPGVVVLGGSLPHAGALLLEPMRAALRERVLSTSLETTAVRVSALGDDAVALGGATLVLQRALAQPDLLLQHHAVAPGGAALHSA